MKEHRLQLDICAIFETKKEGNKTTNYNNYILIYSAKGKKGRAKSGVGLLIHGKYHRLHK